MEQRKQFTFYSSIYESAKRIKNKAARAEFYDAICAYALSGEEPDLDKLPDSAAVGFISAKPNLDASRKKAANGKAGGTAKQTASKAEATGKQTASEKEIEVEKEKEIEIEIENECYKNNCGGDGGDARAHVSGSVSLIGLEPGEFCSVTDETIESVRRLTSQLILSTVRPAVVTDCRNVFIRSFRFNGKSWVADKDLLDLLKYAFDEAAIAGKPANWSYIGGILDRLSFRGITNLQQAREYDKNRNAEEA